MKKRIICLAVFFCLAVGVMAAGCGGTEKSSSDGQQNDSVSDKKKESKIINLKTETYIQEAIDNANLIAGERMFQHANGEIYVHEEMVNFPYAYYGKEKKQLRESFGRDCLAILDDGSVYNGTTLITDVYNVKDIVNSNSAYFITESGKVLSYGKNSYDSPFIDESGSSYYDYNVLYEENLENIVAGCEYHGEGDSEYQLEGGRLRLFLDKDGNCYDWSMDASFNENWPGCTIEGWKDAVVMDCMKNEYEGTSCIAAIAADGTVYATGDYADEILSWGELAYITMNDSIIAGLKKDGTLAFTGSNTPKIAGIKEDGSIEYADGFADELSGEGFSGVKGIRLCDEYMIVMTEKGFIWINMESFDPDAGINADYGYSYLDAEGPGNMENYILIETDGTVKENIDGVWQESGYPKLNSDPQKNLFALELGKEEIVWGDNKIALESGGSEWEQVTSEELSFQLIDINQDGEKEIFVRNESMGGGFGCIYNGRLRIVLTQYNFQSFQGYYPSSGILLVDDGQMISYWMFGNGVTCVIGQKMKETGNCFVHKDFRPEDVEREDPSEEFSHMQEKAFDDMIKGYIGDEEMQSIDPNAYVENTFENRMNLQ